jgi:hypothetical protein
MEENVKQELLDYIYDMLIPSDPSRKNNWLKKLARGWHEMEDVGSADPEVSKSGEITLQVLHNGKKYQIVLKPKFKEVS